MLIDLCNDVELKGNVCFDVVGLVKVMCEMLGEDVLVFLEELEECKKREVVVVVWVKVWLVVRKKVISESLLLVVLFGGDLFNVLK